MCKMNVRGKLFLLALNFVAQVCLAQRGRPRPRQDPLDRWDRRFARYRRNLYRSIFPWQKNLIQRTERKCQTESLVQAGDERLLPEQRANGIAEKNLSLRKERCKVDAGNILSFQAMEGKLNQEQQITRMAFTGLAQLVRAVQAGQRQTEDLQEEIRKQNRRIRKLEKKIKEKKVKGKKTKRNKEQQKTFLQRKREAKKIQNRQSPKSLFSQSNEKL